MSRTLRALAAAVAMAASFAATLLLMQGRRERALPPHLADLVPPAAVAARPQAIGVAPQPAPDPRNPDAEETLAERAAAAEAREEALRAALFSVPASPDTTLDGALEAYRERLREAFAEMPGLDPVEQRALFTEVFLRNASIQAELAAMGPGERERALEHIRREMGFTEAEIARLEQLDARREARWERGLAYMEERRRIAATFEGEALESELDHLRSRSFGHEAETIAREEAMGFFRYERPRVYGRN